MNLPRLSSSEWIDRDRDIYEQIRSATSREQLEMVQSLDVLVSVVREGTRRLRSLAYSKGQDSCGYQTLLERDVEMLCSLLHASLTQYPSSRYSGKDALALLEFGSMLATLDLRTDFARYLFETIATYSAVRESDLAFRVTLERLLLLSRTDGHLSETKDGLLDLMKRIYVAKDRNSVSAIAGAYAELCLRERKTRHAYRALRFALHYYYPDMAPLQGLTQQILGLSSGMMRLLTGKDYENSTRIICSLTAISSLLQRLPFRKFGALRLIRGVRRKYICAINYAAKIPRYYLHWAACVNETSESASRSTLSDRPLFQQRKHPEHILITRAMGGIGDLLMMTPGIHALRSQYPQSEIHMAIPRPLFPVLSTNSEVNLVDIHRERLDPTAYDRWFNLTDCPTVRVEPATAPNVKMCRIEIFSASLGIGARALSQSGTRPHFAFSEEELDFQKAFFGDHGLHSRSVIGVHLKSADSYKDYPHMEDLVRSLLSLPDTRVLLFDGEPIHGFDYPGVIKVDYLPLRKAFALASGCRMIIAPDSAFVHLAASQDIPCLALYGPTDGRVFTKFYDRCRPIDSRESLPCVPCWRHEYTPCKLTGRHESNCLSAIPVEKIVEETRRLLSELGRQGKRYGESH